MKSNGFGKLMAFLNLLEQEKISYSLAHNRDETMMVNVAIPGQRWEVEFFADGSVEVEKFISSGDIAGEDVLSELFAMYSDSDNHAVEFQHPPTFANAK